MAKAIRKAKKRRAAAPAEALQELGAVDPLNRSQAAALKAVDEHAVTFLLGEAGTGKTHLACVAAVLAAVEGRTSKIVLARPVVESGENLGYLPGTYAEKTAPYLLPIYDVVEKIAGRSGKRRDQVNAMLTVAPIAYMRGRTFDNSYVILDEAQNCTASQLKLVISRLGKFSRLIITGDPTQSDLPKRDRALADVVIRLQRLKAVHVHRFIGDDIVRHPALKEILECLSDIV